MDVCTTNQKENNSISVNNSKTYYFEKVKTCEKIIFSLILVWIFAFSVEEIVQVWFK